MIIGTPNAATKSPFKKGQIVTNDYHSGEWKITKSLKMPGDCWRYDLRNQEGKELFGCRDKDINATKA